MRRMLFTGVFALCTVAMTVSAVRALVAIALPVPGPERFTQAEVIVVGKVIEVEEKEVQVAGINYKIAVVQVSEAIKGTMDRTIKVGFVSRQVAPPGKIRPPIRPGFGGLQFAKDQEGMFILTKGPEGKFYTAPMYYHFISAQAGNFKQEIRDARFAIKIGDRLVPALKSMDADERVFAASTLIRKYRAPMIGGRQEAIDAEESKLILKALASADWAQPMGQSHPWMVFNQLGVTAKDGWTPVPVRDIRELHKAAKDWLEKNADTYRIQKNVGGRPAIGPGPGILPVDPPIPLPVPPLPPVKIQPLPVQPVQPLPGQPVPPVRIQPVLPGQPVPPAQVLPVQPPLPVLPVVPEPPGRPERN